MIMRKAMEYEEHSEGNTGDHTEDLKTLDESALNDAKLVSSVEERLRNLNEITKEVDDSADLEDETDDSTPPVPDDEKVEDETGKEEESEESDDATPKKDGGDDDNPVQIPEAFVRAAVHQGWKQEDVDNLIKLNPELALTTLTSCYNSVNNATREWSELGRARIEAERAKESAAATSKSADVDPLISKLKETYGNDPLIETVSEILKRTGKVEPQSQTASRDMYATATARANAAANANTDSKIANWFQSEAMKPYEEYYGKVGLSQSVSDLTNGQQEHRLAVLEEAECILTGLRMRGRDASIEEVLEKAHLVVTEPIREKVILGKLKKTAVERKQSMTFRPSKSKKTSTTTDFSQQKPKTRQDLIAKVEQKLASVPGLRN